jgi:hypothetical protein
MMAEREALLEVFDDRHPRGTVPGPFQ